MKIVADLHLHSKYSRAVSQQMMPQVMSQWAEKKGLDLLATSDWTHPLWLKELESQLKEVKEGIYGLEKSKVKFILSTEISSIYTQNGSSRRIHNLVIAPSLKTVHKINTELKRRHCNLMSDGRPIIGLSSQELAELVWSIDEKCLIIPCHVWTPWFSLYGSKSGFDSLEECFGKLANKIYAIETGLSSDPAMNWQIQDLDNKSIVSFSDAHSPAKMGREATVFELKNLDFNCIAAALDIKKQQKANKILYTIEFYPEEGKYHYSGHRNCAIKHSPKETKKRGETCSVCGKPLTLGVMHRVDELAKGRVVEIEKKQNSAGLVGYYNNNDKKRPPYVMLVSLIEILSESLNVGTTSKKVANEYERLINSLGSELAILTRIKLKEIERLAGEKIAQGIEKVRKGDIVIDPGFDGVFGSVKIWQNKDSLSKSELPEKEEKQISLF